MLGPRQAVKPAERTRPQNQKRREGQQNSCSRQRRTASFNSAEGKSIEFCSKSYLIVKCNESVPKGQLRLKFFNLKKK